MPDYVISKVADALNEEGKALRASKILVLGLAYKANVDDCRESPSFVLMEKLESKGAVVEYHDSYVPIVPPTREHAHFNGKQSVEIEDATISFSCPPIMLSTRISISVIIPALLWIQEIAFKKGLKNTIRHE